LYMTICTVYWSRPYAQFVGHNLKKKSSSLAHHLEQATSHASHFHTVSAQAQTKDTRAAVPDGTVDQKIKYWFSPTFITDWHIIQSISLRTRSFRPSPDGSNSPGAKFHLYLPRLDRSVSDSEEASAICWKYLVHKGRAQALLAVSLSLAGTITRVLLLVNCTTHRDRERETEGERERDRERGPHRIHIHPSGDKRGVEEKRRR
jgi:hypothetical protein